MSYPTREWMLDFIRGNIHYGEFVLSSGKSSTYYIDLQQAMTHADFFDGIISMVSSSVDVASYAVFAGIELGSVPIVSALAHSLLEVTYPGYVIVRKDGTLIGHGYLEEPILLIEDVTTTGASLMKAIQILRENGAKSIEALAIVDREEGAEAWVGRLGVKFKSIFTVSELRV